MLTPIVSGMMGGGASEATVSLAGQVQLRAERLANFLSFEPALPQVWSELEPAQWSRVWAAVGSAEAEVAAVARGEGLEPEERAAGVEGGTRERRLRLRRANRAEVIPIPARLEELIAVDHPARLIWEAAEQFDLRPFEAHLRVEEGGAGRPAIDPLILVALWLYANYDGVDSARDLGQRCVENLPYIWLCGGVTVNYHSLSDFRVDHQAALEELMTGLLHDLDQAGLINWDSQAQDGLRVRASAGAASFRRQLTLEKRLAEAQAASEAAPLAASEPRSPGQQAAQARAVREKVDRLEAALAEMPAARAAKPTDQQAQARVSPTDPQARVMKMADGGYRPAYNWQFAVETRHLIITGVDVVNSGSDKGQLLPMLAQVQARHQRLPANWLSDGGFVNLAAFRTAAQLGVCIYAPVPTPRDEGRDPYLPLPDDSPAVAAWRERMGTDTAKTLYKQRAASVECVNAQTRAHRGVQQVRVRGQAKVKCVALWTAITHNLLIWLRHLRQTLTPSPLVGAAASA